MSISDDVWIIGINMTRFGKHPDSDLIDLAARAALGALADSGRTMREMDVLAAGSVMDQTGVVGQTLQKQIGQTGIPVFNVTNACATGATALRTVIMAIKSGEAKFGLAVGTEKLSGRGMLGGGSRAKDDDIWEARGRLGAVAPIDGRLGTDVRPGLFGQIGLEYAAQQGLDALEAFDVFARISEKNHAHSTLNPLSTYQKRFTLDEIKNDIMISFPNTRAMCSANSDGAAAAVVTSGEVLKTLPLEVQRRAVKVSASVLRSDPWTEGNQVFPDINTLTRDAAALAYEQAGIGPKDLDLVELHDCFASAELVHYDNLGLCEPGGAVDLVRSGATWRDGTTPVNVSGGLQSKGHPIAATGIANIWEICTHLRGEAGERQIAGAKVGLAHVLGLGSAVGVHILERAA